ncbi:hypothetical protein Tco_0958241 [Tanacetum coccineum]
MRPIYSAKLKLLGSLALLSKLLISAIYFFNHLIINCSRWIDLWTPEDCQRDLLKAHQVAEMRLFVNRIREEAQTSRNMIGQLTALVAEMEAFDDPGEVFDTLMGLRDDIRVEEAKLAGLNDLITQVEEEIEMKEA